MGTPGIFNAPKLMFGTSPPADPCSGRADRSCTPPGHNQLNPGKIQGGLNPCTSLAIPQRLPQGGCCMWCSAHLPLISR